jgi:hypothetical protein
MSRYHDNILNAATPEQIAEPLSDWNDEMEAVAATLHVIQCAEDPHHGSFKRQGHTSLAAALVARGIRPVPPRPLSDVRRQIEALPEMVGEPNEGGRSLVHRSAVLAAIPATPDVGLDVERLARALEAVRAKDEAEFNDSPLWQYDEDVLARHIAAEYVRLAQEPPRSETDQETV